MIILLILSCIFISDDMKEDFSDACMSEVIGTGGHVKCGLSAKCTDRMLSRGLKGYALMHQLLYTMLCQLVSVLI
jgi:hypothetical protein